MDSKPSGWLAPRLFPKRSHPSLSPRPCDCSWRSSTPFYPPPGHTPTQTALTPRTRPSAAPPRHLTENNPSRSLLGATRWESMQLTGFGEILGEGNARMGDWGNARRMNTVAKNSTEDKRTVEKLSDKKREWVHLVTETARMTRELWRKKRLWAKRE